MENIEILKNFHNKCEENKIWYSLCGFSLLDCKLNKNEIMDNTIEIFMTEDSYKIFKNMFNENIFDSSINNSYFYLCPIYFEKNSNIVIKINLLVKAGIKKTEKYYSIRNMWREKIGFYKSIKGKTNFFTICWYKFLNIFCSPLIWQEVASKIYDEKNGGFFLIDSFIPNINENWIQSISFNVEKCKWLDVEVNVFEEYDNYLKKRFSINWEKEAFNKKKRLNASLLLNDQK